MIAGIIWLMLVSYSFTVWLTFVTQGRFPPQPPPLRNRVMVRLLGMVGGVAAGTFFLAAMGVPTPQPAISLSYLGAATVVAFVGATIATDLFSRFGGWEDPVAPR